MSAPASARANAVNERQPLMKSLSPSTTASLCTAFVVLGLVMAWCVADLGQRALSSDLFNMAMMKPTPKGPDFHAFAYPLTLAMVEFAFMGILFSVVYAVVVQDRLGTGQTSAMTLAPDRCWATLVVSHVCGTFWLQSLMMPSQVMSLGLFAVSRAADIPMTNLMRSKVLGLPLGKRQLQTTCLIFAAACTLFYSYAQLSGCVCIWSGNGVALTGLAFWIVYFLILALPAANAVCQEAILLQRESHPVMILAVQNLFACLLFTPVLSVAQFMGWEDVNEGLSMIFQQKQILMIVIWLCLAMAATQAACILLVSMTNSFWSVALRALRVVIWGGQMLTLYSLGSPLPLSIACPHSSLWALVLTSGTFLAMVAIYRDMRSQEEDTMSDTSKASSLAVPAGDASKATASPGA
mmetsp:Transcript_81205/g.143850  ORF Transcript_81205/g.143850 Transcript_81205/m.143850 type:complete len:409 (-) Transcript_81205:67-1293(-)